MRVAVGERELNGSATRLGQREALLEQGIECGQIQLKKFLVTAGAQFPVHLFCFHVIHGDKR
jgi:hypothetical protein